MSAGQPPLFLTQGSYAEMWEAWKAIQSSGHGSARGSGWSVEQVERGNGSYVIRLEVTFVREGTG